MSTLSTTSSFVPLSRERGSRWSRRGPLAAGLAGALVTLSSHAGTLSAFSGVVAGFGNGSIAAGCTTYGPPSDLAFFGGAAAGLQVLGGNAACGYGGGFTNKTSTGSTAPLFNSASVAPTLLGNPGYAESFDGTSASRASYGSLSATAHGRLSGSPVSWTAGTTITAAVGAATFSDTLTASVPKAYTDLSSSGFVRYVFSIDGSMSTPPPHLAFFGGEALTEFAVQQAGGPVYALLEAETSTESTGSFFATPGGSAGWSVGPGLVTGGSVVESPLFSIDLLSSWNFTAGLIVNAYGNADDDFMSTAKLVGIDLFDSNGVAITDFSISAGSGIDYLAPAATVPEPGSLASMLVGFLGLIGWRARRGNAATRR
jgi:hypothetical protein